MGWLWGANEAKPKPSTSNPNNDPLRDLDPSLRDFLQTESPSAQHPSSPAAPSSSSQPPSEPKSGPDSTSSAPNSSSDASSSSSTSTSPPTPAPPMVYSDGRYADLWSGYRPLGVIEDESKSDQEKLSDVLETYNQRKALVGRAALENCALEQIGWSDCLKTGGFVKRMNMCRKEHKSFERCYVMQAKFLKALGYLASPRPAEVEEQIQMHADTLYHRMLAQEAAVAEAKASNAPIPTFPPMLSPSSNPFHSSSSFSSSTQTPATTATDPTTKTPFSSPPPPPPPSSSSSPSPTQQDPQPSSPYLPPRPLDQFSKDYLTPSARAGLQKRLEELPPEAREVEERAVAMEASQTDAVGRTVDKLVSEHERKRRERRERGEAGFGDWFSSWFGR